MFKAQSPKSKSVPSKRKLDGSKESVFCNIWKSAGLYLFGWPHLCHHFSLPDLNQKKRGFLRFHLRGWFTLAQLKDGVLLTRRGRLFNKSESDDESLKQKVNSMQGRVTWFLMKILDFWSFQKEIPQEQKSSQYTSFCSAQPKIKNCTIFKKSCC